MFCRNCGKEFIGTPVICPDCGAKPMSGTSFCSSCGAPVTLLTQICPKCGARVAAPSTWKPTVAGTLDLVAGAIGLLSGAGLMWFPYYGEDIFIGLILFLVGIGAIIGGICNLGRRAWGLALVGSICALWPGMVILGLLAIIWTAQSKGEFR
ncbi:hypothetical protein ES706_01675 [subsurface metagenome]